MTKTPSKPAAQPAAPEQPSTSPAAQEGAQKPAAQPAAPAGFMVVGHIKVDGRRCGPGDTVVLSEADAERMLRSGSVKPLEA